MGGLIEIAGGVLTHATFRVELAAQNLANATTPGYKRRVAFAQLIGPAATPSSGVATDASSGKLTRTGGAFDLAIQGSGYFAVRTSDGVFYTRQGQFERDGEGRLLTPSGAVLQSAEGGDLIVAGPAAQVLADGLVLEGGEAAGRIALYELNDGAVFADGPDGLFAAADGALSASRGASLIQGAFETSNVSAGEEMTAIMAALRQAETAQRLINVYDDLLGRALSTFGPPGG